ncbi:MAG: prolipoprotein diacylglyceryl transferase [Pseudomonadota bacterium]
MLPAVINHPEITNPKYSTIMLSWFDGAFHFFERVPIGGDTVVLLSTYYFAYFLCFVVIFFMIRHWQRDGSFKVLPYQVFDLMIVTIIGVLLGAKLAYVLFYNLEFFIEHPLQIFTNWSGMSSHGAAAGFILGLWLYCRRAKINFLHVLDQAGVCVAVAPIFIRTANFLNGELYGRSASEAIPWAMRFYMSDGVGRPLCIDRFGDVYRLIRFSDAGELLSRAYLKPLGAVFKQGYESFAFISKNFPDHILAIPVGRESGPIELVARLITDPRHPSQFYQLLVSGVLLLTVLLIIRKRVKTVGITAACAFVGYGITRFFVEFFRAQDFQRSTGMFQYISMGQILSLVLIAVGVGVFIYSRRQGLKIADLTYPPFHK